MSTTSGTTTRTLKTQRSLALVQSLFAAAAGEDADNEGLGAAPPPPALASPSGGSQHGSQGRTLAGMQRQLSKKPTLGRLTRSSSRACSLRSLGSLEGDAEEPAVEVRRPTLAYSGKAHLLLLKRCLEAVEVLERVQQPIRAVEAVGEPKPPLPKAALRFAKGLAFFVQRKVGLVGGMAWGQGCVISRLPDGSWSPPCFMRLRHCSLGITFGLQRTESCHVLQNTEQLAAFMRSRGSFGFDAAISQDADPFDPEAPAGGVTLIMHRDGVARGRKMRPYCAMVSDGAIWDLSVRGGYTRVDRSLNCLVYGKGVSPQEILEGRVALPAEFCALHDAVEAAAAEAQLSLPTVSKYQMARQKSLQTLGRVSASVVTPKTATNVIMRMRLMRAEMYQEASRAHAGDGGGLFGGADGFKLFNDVTIGFQERHTYAKQEEEEPVAVGGDGDGLFGGASDFKLFNDVTIGFKERHTYVLQEEEEQQQVQQQREEEAAA